MAAGVDPCTCAGCMSTGYCSRRDSNLASPVIQTPWRITTTGDLPGLGWNWATNPAPIQMYVIQTCPVCRGAGLVRQGFYTAVGQETFTSDHVGPDQCQTCDGKGILKVGAYNGSVEKVE